MPCTISLFSSESEQVSVTKSSSNVKAFQAKTSNPNATASNLDSTDKSVKSQMSVFPATSLPSIAEKSDKQKGTQTKAETFSRWTLCGSYTIPETPHSSNDLLNNSVWGKKPTSDTISEEQPGPDDDYCCGDVNDTQTVGSQRRVTGAFWGEKTNELASEYSQSLNTTNTGGYSESQQAWSQSQGGNDTYCDDLQSVQTPRIRN